jgi:hypothetical protein
VVQPLEYLMTAKELGNQIENVKNNETLQQFLTQVFCLLFYVWFLVSLVKATVFEAQKVVEFHIFDLAKKTVRRCPYFFLESSEY